MLPLKLECTQILVRLFVIKIEDIALTSSLKLTLERIESETLKMTTLQGSKLTPPATQVSLIDTFFFYHNHTNQMWNS